ncbi:MAG: hypothetical protein HXY35_12940 [Chloroflexi bacterium]|nr:hypothetical protein [Chloroflexota bacterium]
MTDNLYLIRLELTQEEGQALDALATRECRLTWEQARYLLRSQLITLGALVPDPSNPITANMETR